MIVSQTENVVKEITVHVNCWVLFKGLFVYCMLSVQVFDLFDQCKLYTLMTINFVLSLCRNITISINTIHSFSFFFYKNLLYKNVEAEINQNCKNVLRTFLRLRRSRLRTFLFWCLYINEQSLFILNCYKILNFNTIKTSTLIGFLVTSARF